MGQFIEGDNTSDVLPPRVSTGSLASEILLIMRFSRLMDAKRLGTVGVNCCPMALSCEFQPCVPTRVDAQCSQPRIFQCSMLLMRPELFIPLPWSHTRPHIST